MKIKHITLRVVLRYASLIVIFGAFLFYALFQARLLLTGPVITFTDSLSPEQTERAINIEGIAQNITKITLNGRDIYTDKNGYFKEVLILENGYTIATVEGFDRYGRTTSLTRSFIYTPSEWTNVH